MSTNGRVCFIIPGNIFSTPYLQRYLSLLQKPYDLVIWNCAGVEESAEANKIVVFQCEMLPSASIFAKIIGYLRFQRLASRTILEENYDAVVLMTGVAAVLLAGTLASRYRGRYIIDIRDYYKENHLLYYLIEKYVIKLSGLVVISSRGFEKFLPKHDYIITHNINYLPEHVINEARCKAPHMSDKIVLAYIGNMRFPEQDKHVLAFFANDDRFQINLFGRGYGKLQEYCQAAAIKNVSIVDWFPPEKTVDYYLKTDIILNLYGNHSPLLDYALSNKLYYAAQLGKPILVCAETYMEQTVKQYGLGFSLNLENNSEKDALLSYYRGIQWQQFLMNCDAFLNQVRSEDCTFNDAVADFLN